MKLVVNENGILQNDNVKDLYPGSKPTKTNFIDAEKKELDGFTYDDYTITEKT